MREITQHQFMKLPPGVLFRRINSPYNLQRGLFIKGDTVANLDWYEQELGEICFDFNSPNPSFDLNKRFEIPGFYRENFSFEGTFLVYDMFDTSKIIRQLAANPLFTTMIKP